MRSASTGTVTVTTSSTRPPSPGKTSTALCRALHELGVRPAFFRPPYGQVSGGSLIAARRAGLDLVLWSAWGREWADDDSASVSRRIEQRLGSGSIVLLHDSDVAAVPGTAARAAAAVEQLSGTLTARGLTAVTMSELVRR